MPLLSSRSWRIWLYLLLLVVAITIVFQRLPSNRPVFLSPVEKDEQGPYFPALQKSHLRPAVKKSLEILTSNIFEDKYINEALLSLSGVYISANNTIEEFIYKSENNVRTRTISRDEVIYKYSERGLPRYSGFSPHLKKVFDEKTTLAKATNDERPKRAKTSNALIALTTCNQLIMTIKCLSYLTRNVPAKVADIIIIDDHSVDGTVPYLRKKGYFVIEKDAARGLTHSWNIAYEISLQMGYQYLLYANNDVLLPKLALEAMLAVLQKEAVVVPLTTAKGAGHNPSQDILRAYNVSSRMADYVDNPVNVDRVQEALLEKYCSFVVANSSKAVLRLGKREPSQWKGRPKFNGFFFGINLKKILPVAYRHPTLLFDDNNVVVGQEDQMLKLIMTGSGGPGVTVTIAMCAFVFHYKSVTIKMASSISSSASLQYVSRKSSGVSLDRRNDISYFHPELSGPELHQPDAIPYSAYANFSPDTAADRVYTSASQRADKVRSFKVGFVTSNPHTNPSAGDVFTAFELAQALQSAYRNVEVGYLRRGKDWYDEKMLGDIDIIVVLLDAYDLARALSTKRSAGGNRYSPRGAKSSLIAIAWIRNWHHRWLARPWIGNYDMLLTSSEAARDSLVGFAINIGLQTVCVANCPCGMSLGRVPAPVEILRLATNPARFNQHKKPLSRFVADYAFTGSYYNVSRDIMQLRPSSLPFKGVIVGSGWDAAPNVSAEFLEMLRGSVPYSIVPSVYTSVKVVVDDANHVTAPWGSLNSRVFDALASGALVITNCKVGAAEIFGGLLPTYATSEELVLQLNRSLSGGAATTLLTKRLRQVVLANHTYAIRAAEFSQIMQRRFNVTFHKRKAGAEAAAHAPPQPVGASICVGIRTMPAHGNQLDVLLRSFVGQELRERAKDRPRIKIRYFLVDTEGDVVFKDAMHGMVSDANSMLGDPNAMSVVSFEKSATKSTANQFFGYDDTDELVAYMLSLSECRQGWVMLTNGDNLYNGAWLSTVAPLIRDKKLSMVAWDFITHHSRSALQEPKQLSTEQLVRVAFRRGFVDLGSMMVRASAIERSNARFLPLSVFTTDLFARDFFFVQQVLSVVDEHTAARLVHKTLLFHQ